MVEGMKEIFTNLTEFAEKGFRFPDHTAFIWTAYGISFLVLLLLFVWTQTALWREKKSAARIQREREARSSGS